MPSSISVPPLRLIRLGGAFALTRAIMMGGDHEPLVAMQYWP